MRAPMQAMLGNLIISGKVAPTMIADAGTDAGHAWQPGGQGSQDGPMFNAVTASHANLDVMGHTGRKPLAPRNF